MSTVHTAAGAAATELIIEIFRLNGRLLESGDDLVRNVGLTSARWQVLGAIAASPVPLPVSHVARNMGLTRQAVQRLANDLELGDLVRFAPNPHDERARLLAMTDNGATAFKTAMARQVPWANRLAKGVDRSYHPRANQWKCAQTTEPSTQMVADCALDRVLQ